MSNRNKVAPIDEPSSLPSSFNSSRKYHITIPKSLGTKESSSVSERGSRESEKDEPIVRQNGVSATVTLINFLKGMIGPGCLSLPLAFKQGGLVTTLCLIVLFGFLNNFCMLQIVHCSQRLTRRKGNAFMDYGTVAYESCAASFKSLRKYKRYARLMVNVTIILLQTGVCSVFYVFIATHLKEICEEVSNVRISEISWMLIILVPMILVSMLRTLKTIAIISAAGNILMIASLIFIFQYLLRAEHEWNNLPWITNFNGIMAASGSILYSFEGQATVLPMENRLKHPQYMVGPLGILSIGMSIVTTIYAMAGLTGYVTFGEHVRGSITQSLPNDPIFIVVRVMLTLVIYFGYVIQLYVIVDMIWPHLRSLINLNTEEEKCPIASTTSSTIFGSTSTVTESVESLKNNSKQSKMRVFGAEFLLRTGVVLVTMVIAILVPNLENIIPLVGVTFGMLLAFIFPATIDTILFVPELLEESDGRITSCILLRIVQNVGLCFVGVFGLIFGLKSNIETIFLDHVQ